MKALVLNLSGSLLISVNEDHSALVRVSKGTIALEYQYIIIYLIHFYVFNGIYGGLRCNTSQVKKN